MDTENIIIVNEKDEPTGSLDKLHVHKKGILHRAFSIVLFDSNGNMLIQKRSKSKYHSPGLWANACCSHQRAGETLEESADRRLQEELGLHDIGLSEAFILRYRCITINSLIENEIDHVFYGQYSGGSVSFNREEIEQIDWVSPDELKSTINNDAYAYWFKLIFKRIIDV